jgi:hypothetical protein
MATHGRPDHDRLKVLPNSGTAPRAVSGELRILLIEDVPDEAELTIRHVRRGGIECIWHRVDTELAYGMPCATSNRTSFFLTFRCPSSTGLRRWQ